MKRTISCLLFSLALGMGVSAQTITVSDIEALASGETVNANLHIAGVSEMTSMHFEVQLPSMFAVGTVSATPEWTALFSQEAGVVSAMSTSANAFSGEGDIACLPIVVPGNTTTGTYPVIIKNIRINGITLEEEVSFNVNVVTLHTCIFDEESETLPLYTEKANVKVKRTINANEWSTICLPFAMTAAQVATAFGSDVKIGDFDGCDVDGETNDITVKFVSTTAVEANHPYIIKVGKLVKEFTVDGVDIAADKAEVKKDKNGRRYNSFIGNYENGFVLEDGMLFLNSNKFFFSTGKTKMKAFRAYFALDAADAYYESRVNMTFEDNTTGITDNNREAVANSHWYSLSGQQVQKPGKGIYVREGKKVVMKHYVK